MGEGQKIAYGLVLVFCGIALASYLGSVIAPQSDVVQMLILAVCLAPAIVFADYCHDRKLGSHAFQVSCTLVVTIGVWGVLRWLGRMSRLPEDWFTLPADNWLPMTVLATIAFGVGHFVVGQVFRLGKARRRKEKGKE